MQVPTQLPHRPTRARGRARRTPTGPREREPRLARCPGGSRPGGLGWVGAAAQGRERRLSLGAGTCDGDAAIAPGSARPSARSVAASPAGWSGVRGRALSAARERGGGGVPVATGAETGATTDAVAAGVVRPRLGGQPENETKHASQKKNKGTRTVRRPFSRRPPPAPSPRRRLGTAQGRTRAAVQALVSHRSAPRAQLRSDRLPRRSCARRPHRRKGPERLCGSLRGVAVLSRPGHTGRARTRGAPYESGRTARAAANQRRRHRTGVAGWWGDPTRRDVPPTTIIGRDVILHSMTDGRKREVNNGQEYRRRTRTAQRNMAESEYCVI